MVPEATGDLANFVPASPKSWIEMEPGRRQPMTSPHRGASKSINFKATNVTSSATSQGCDTAQNRLETREPFLRCGIVF